MAPCLGSCRVRLIIAMGYTLHAPKLVPWCALFTYSQADFLRFFLLALSPCLPEAFPANGKRRKRNRSSIHYRVKIVNKKLTSIYHTRHKHFYDPIQLTIVFSPYFAIIKITKSDKIIINTHMQFPITIKIIQEEEANDAPYIAYIPEYSI